MSSTNRRFIVAYILLVGLPLVGLAGVLKSGRGLAAPISIDGVWKVETSSSTSTSAAEPCDRAISSLLNSSLLVSQSGRSFELTLNGASKTTVDGSIDGKTLKASLGPVSGCASGQTVTLVASVDPQSDPKSLSGSLTAADCASCMPLQFRAVRQPRPQAAGGGH